MHRLLTTAVLMFAHASFAQQAPTPPAAPASAAAVKHAAALLDTTPPARCTNPAFLNCASMSEEQCTGAYKTAVAEINAQTLKDIGDKTPSDEDLRFYRMFALGKFTPYFLAEAKVKADTFMRCNQKVQ